VKGHFTAGRASADHHYLFSNRHIPAQDLCKTKHVGVINPFNRWSTGEGAGCQDHYIGILRFHHVNRDLLVEVALDPESLDLSLLEFDEVQQFLFVTGHTA